MRFLNLLLYLIIITVVSVWVIDSIDYGKPLVFTQDSKIEEIETYDELFDTTSIETKVTPGFWLGLFPGDDSISINILFGVVPLLGVLVLIRFLIYIINKRRSN